MRARDKIKNPHFIFIIIVIMRTLVDYLRECGCGCCSVATPANTVGMGGVEPLSSDPVPTNKNIKKKKIRRRRIVKRQ